MSRAALDQEIASPRRSLWGNRNFLLLWSGQTVGAIGPQITLIALPLIALRSLNASTFQVSLLTFCGWLPYLLFSLPAGVLVERWNQRRIMMCCDLARLALLAALPVLGMAGLLGLWSMYSVVIVTGCLTVLFTVAYRNQLPRLVSASELLDGNSKLGMSESLAELVGPAAGGALAGAVGAVSAIYGNIATYAISAFALRLIRVPEDAEKPVASGRVRLLDSIREGLGYLRRERVLRSLLLCTSLSNFFVIALSSIAITFMTRVLHATPTVVGLISSGGAVGGIVAGVFAARISKKVGSARIIWMSMLIPGPLYLLMPLAQPGWGAALYALGTAVLAADVTLFNASAISYRQSVCPPQLLSRVNASYLWVAYGVIPLGSLFGGVLGEAAGLRTTALICVLGTWAASLFVVFSPLRAMRDIPAALPADREPCTAS